PRLPLPDALPMSAPARRQYGGPRRVDVALRRRRARLGIRRMAVGARHHRAFRDPPVRSGGPAHRAFDGAARRTIDSGRSRSQRASRGPGHGGRRVDVGHSRTAGRLCPPAGPGTGRARGHRRNDAGVLARLVCVDGPQAQHAGADMIASPPAMRRALARNRREVVTPEGLALPLTIASRGARAGALLLDLGLIFIGLLALSLSLLALGIGALDTDSASEVPAIELLVVLLILIVFLSRYAYFLYFELGPRGATPGKRALGIRVAARGGGRLTAEAVLARNLIRDIEVFLPTAFLLSGLGNSLGAMGGATAVWLAIFVLFPFFNRDNLRAGDL